MTVRRADVFFYGLFMDQDLLRAKGFAPQASELGYIDGFALRIGRRAAVAPHPGERVYGVVMSLELPELEALYSEPSVQAYRPEAVLVHLVAGGAIAALCYNLPAPPPASERDADYVTKLRDVGRKVGLPADYLDSLR
jgi:hypothetical protein